MTPEQALQKAVKIAGSKRQLALQLGIAAQNLTHWKRVPAERVLAVEAATGVAKELLRPDIYPVLKSRS